MSRKRRRKSANKRGNTAVGAVNKTGVVAVEASGIKCVETLHEADWKPLDKSCGCAGSDPAPTKKKPWSLKDFFTVMKAVWRKLWKTENGKILLVLCFCIILQCVCMMIWANASNTKSKAIAEALSTEVIETEETVIEPVMEVFLPVTTVNKYEIIDDGLVHNVPVDGAVRSLLQSVIGDNVSSWYKKADYVGFADLDNTGVPELIVWNEDWHYTVYKINLETAELKKWQEFNTEGSLSFGYYRDSQSALNVWVGTVNGENTTYEVFFFNDSDLVRESVSKSDFRDTYTLIGADNLFVRSKRLDKDSNYTAIVQTLLDLYYD